MKKFLLVSPKNRTAYNFRGDLIRDIRAKGYDVVVTGPNRDHIDRIEALGARFIEIPMNKTGINILSDLRYLWRLFKVMRREKPDITLGYTIKPVIYGAIAACLAGVPNRNSMITGGGLSFHGCHSQSEDSACTGFRALPDRTRLRPSRDFPESRRPGRIRIQRTSASFEMSGGKRFRSQYGAFRAPAVARTAYLLHALARTIQQRHPRISPGRRAGQVAVRRSSVHAAWSRGTHARFSYDVGFAALYRRRRRRLFW